MAKKKPPATGSVPVESTRHLDRRTNIPTAEQGPVVAEEPPPLIRYPRDPSLDPQLVWKTKDEQDGKDLEVPAVPLYIQEKIHPRALIDDLRRRGQGGPRQAELFATFDDLEAGKRLEFYQHTQQWTNRLILGDSLLVMTSLAEKERLKGRVQMIYFDPPYGIKFGSNWQVSTRKRDVKDAKAEDLTRQPEQIKAFRDTWELGIHSYLTYLRDRLIVARELLTESGSVFVQIGDTNVHLVRCLMDEVFGSENCISQVAFRKTAGATSEFLPPTADHLLWYSKDRAEVKYHALYLKKGLEEGGAGAYDQIELPDGTRRRLNTAEHENQAALPARARVFRHQILTSPRIREARTGYFAVTFKGREYLPSTGEWKTHREGMHNLVRAGRVALTGSSLSYVRFIDDFPAYPLTNVWDDTQSGSGMEKVYVVQTNSKVIERCLLMTTDPGDLVLDPTCGSGTTAYVAEQWGRRWITTDTSRVALALARTRLMAARFPYYLLADSPEGRRKEADLTAVPTPADAPPCENDVRKGFVYKRVPHVTLKSIANNPDIRDGMSREQIDAAIARHAETETLYDQPYEDKNIVRVCGPFTVESLSPHRALPSDMREPQGADAPRSPGAIAGDFVLTILDNLRKAGVQNTKKGERLVFDRLDLCNQPPFQYEGEYTENGQPRRIAVCLGPEFGTVGPDLVRKAALQAHRGLGYDTLLVCGFAFDPHVEEEGRLIEKQMGKVKVLPVRMHADLSMGDELLKKTGSGNLFTVFGEPDIQLTKQPGGQYVAAIKGLDVFDPTTGELRSGGTEDVACWFLDTDYDGESFFVRHAYFCGGGDPYEKLKRALKAEIDEAEWAKLYATQSVPFDPPASGRIAVKVTNHYGDEVLKVYPLR